MELFLFIIAVIGWTYGFWQRSKAKEFESLFELSKKYGTRIPVSLPKLNKDGSIAKKRGPKAKK